jgi:hypothetical protein
VSPTPELTIRIGIESRDGEVLRESSLRILEGLANEAVADTPRLAFDFHDLSDWDEPAEFPWDPEILLSLDRIDLVIADAGTSPTALAYLTGRGVPVVVAAGPGDAALRQRLLDGVQQVVSDQLRRSDTECITALGYSANGLALANAAALNQTTGVAALLRIGVSPDSVDATGIPALNRAIRAAAWECVELLLEAGSSVDRPAPDRDSTPLMELASTRRHDLIRQCLARVTEIDHQSGSGQTALIIAVGAKDTETALALLDRGADPHIKDSLGMTAARYAEMFSLAEVLARLS